MFHHYLHNCNLQLYIHYKFLETGTMLLSQTLSNSLQSLAWVVDNTLVKPKVFKFMALDSTKHFSYNQLYWWFLLKNCIVPPVLSATDVSFLRKSIEPSGAWRQFAWAFCGPAVEVVPKRLGWYQTLFWVSVDTSSQWKGWTKTSLSLVATITSSQIHVYPILKNKNKQNLNSLLR